MHVFVFVWKMKVCVWLDLGVIFRWRLVAAMFELTREDWTLDLVLSFFVLHYTLELLTCWIMHYHLQF